MRLSISGCIGTLRPSLKRSRATKVRSRSQAQIEGEARRQKRRQYKKLSTTNLRNVINDNNNNNLPDSYRTAFSEDVTAIAKGPVNTAKYTVLKLLMGETRQEVLRRSF